MRVIQVTRFGGPEVLVPTEVPDPVAGPGEAVIQVAAADTLWVETMIRQVGGGEYFDVKPPYVPGGAVSGQVTAVGDGVDPTWLGRRVAAHLPSNTSGGYAEQAIAPAESLYQIPDQLGLREAAALLHDGVTALGVFDPANVQPGQRVLITAAAGGMGLLLIQLAHAAGAQVIAAARGKRKLDLTLEVGADIALDYSDPNWPQQARQATGNHGADVIFDGAGGEFGQAAFELAADNAWFSAHGTPSGSFTQIDPTIAQQRGITIRGIQDVQYSPTEIKALAERALAAAATGRIKPVIGQTFPLTEAAKAHTAIESRTALGKTLLIP